jgi:hypothetical protein
LVINALAIVPGVNDLACLTLPNVVGLIHDHVVLPATVEILQSVLLSIEAHLKEFYAISNIFAIENKLPLTFV